MLNPRVLWSDDSASLAWLGTDWTTDRYSLRLFRVDVESGEAEELTAALNLADTRYLYITNGSWWSNP